jgi:hypothetical protein
MYPRKPKIFDEPQTNFATNLLVKTRVKARSWSGTSTPLNRHWKLQNLDPGSAHSSRLATFMICELCQNGTMPSMPRYAPSGLLVADRLCMRDGNCSLSNLALTAAWKKNRTWVTIFLSMAPSASRISVETETIRNVTNSLKYVRSGTTGPAKPNLQFSTPQGPGTRHGDASMSLPTLK